MAKANPSTGIRLNKYIARAGVSSRRKADDLIDAGRVRVNGRVVKEYWYRVEEDDEVMVGGKVISPQKKRYLLLNKPEDAITTTDDERGRDTVMDCIDLPEHKKQGLFPVGRLDRDTVGVLLLTNDGDLAHRLMHPSYEIEKLYVVQTRRPVKPHELDRLQRGVELEDGPAQADRIAYLAPEEPTRIGLSIHEGRNRQIRRMMEALGHDVRRLERVNYAGLTAEGLARGQWRELRDHEVRRLRNRVKLRT